MSKKSQLDDTGERMIPGFHNGTVMYAEHMTRYLSAQDLSQDKIVLDIACGSGYGTKILAKNAKKVYGVDVDETSVAYAQENYKAPNIEYKVGDGESIPLEDNTVDLVVTFETIEHIKNYKKFISEVKRVLKPDGLAIVSTPNELEFTEGNHFHLHEFEYDELNGLLKDSFKNIKPYFQATWVNAVIAPEEIIQKEGVYDIATYNFKPLERKKYLYFYLLCSNRQIRESVKPISGWGGHYSARELTDIQNLNDKNIEDYKTVLENSKQENTRLMEEIDRINKDKLIIQEQLKRITSTKVYRAARKLSRAKRGVLGEKQK